MCGEPRVNQSSIRYSDSVKDIINSLPGNTFGDKFEYCALHFTEEKKQKEKELKELESKIKDTEKRLKELSKKFYGQKEVFDKLNSIQHYVDGILKECNTI